jgi:glyoxylase-like metal-dependent hydrolase (beta-lactamase superfamily II)
MKIRFWGVRGSVASSGPKIQHFGGSTSCIEVVEKNQRVILDAGTGLRPLGLQLTKKPSDDDVSIFITHCHLDHVFGNKFVAQTWKLTLQIHPLEEKMLALAPASGLMWNMPFDNYTGQFIFLAEKEKIKLGNDELQVIFAPGHSPGHICFYSAAQSFLIGGDVLFQRSIGRTDLPGGNHQTLLSSIRNQLFILPDETIVYSGHGPQTTIGEEKRENPFLM